MLALAGRCSSATPRGSTMVPLPQKISNPEPTRCRRGKAGNLREQHGEHEYTLASHRRIAFHSF